MDWIKNQWSQFLLWFKTWFDRVRTVAKEHPVLFALGCAFAVMFYKILLFLVFWATMWTIIWYIIEASVNPPKTQPKKQWAVKPDYTIETEVVEVSETV